MKHSFNKVIAEKYGIPEAILFENISYWCEKNHANNQNIFFETPWTYNTYEAFEELFPYLKSNTIKKALRNLKESNLIDIRNDLSENKWDKTNWYSIVNFSNYREVKKGTLDSVKKAPSKGNKKHHDIKEHLLNTNKNTDIKHNYYDCESLPYFNEESFQLAWKEFMTIRNKKKTTHSEYSMKLIFNILNENAKDLQMALDIVNKSVLGGYPNLYPNKTFNNNSKPTTNKWKGEQNFDF